MRPEFDHEEAYLVAFYRQYRKPNSARAVIHDASIVAVGAVFFGLGYFKSDLTWSVIGFGMVAYLGLRSIVAGARYNRVLANIIEKYEDALQTAANPSAPDHEAPP